MKQYVLYDHPDDFPDHYIVREWNIEEGRIAPKGIFARNKSLVFLMELMLHEGMIFMNRSEEDDPKILGVWI